MKRKGKNEKTFLMKNIIFVRNNFYFLITLELMLLVATRCAWRTIDIAFTSNLPLFCNYPFNKASLKFPDHLLIENLTFSETRNVDFNYMQHDRFTLKFVQTRSLHSYYTKLSVADPSKFNQTVAVFKNCFITPFYSVSDGQKIYLFYKHNFMKWTVYNGKKFPIEAYEDEVIAFGHKKIDIFGHFFLDVLVPLMLLPEEILHRAKIFFHHPKDFSIETLQIFGIKPSQFLAKDHYFGVWAKKAYVLVPSPHINMFGWPIIKLSTHLMQHYGIEDLIATDYYIMNRKDGFRSIPQKNFDDIVSYFKTNHPGNNYKTFYCNGTVKETAIIWRTAKFVFAPTGSGNIGMMYMHKHCAVLCAHSTYYDQTMKGIAITYEIFYLCFSVPYSRQWRRIPFKIPIKSVDRLTKVIFYALENHKWPEHNKIYQY